MWNDLKQDFTDEIMLRKTFPLGFSGKELVRDMDSDPRLVKSSGGGHDNPLQYSCLENPHGRRSLAGCSARCQNESDMIERLSTAPKPGRNPAQGSQEEGVPSISEGIQPFGAIQAFN